MKKIFVLFTIVALASCSNMDSKKADDISKQPVASTATSTAWKTFDSPEFSIQYPANWELNDNGQMGVVCTFYAPKDSTDKFNVNVNVLAQEVGSDFNQYDTSNLHQVKMIFNDFNMLDNKLVKNDTDQYRKIIFTTDQGRNHIQFEQEYRVVKQKAYLVTLTTSVESYNKYRETAEKIIGSFKLKK